MRQGGTEGLSAGGTGCLEQALSIRPGHWLLRIRLLPPHAPSFHHGKASGRVREGERFRKYSLLKNIGNLGNGRRLSFYKDISSLYLPRQGGTSQTSPTTHSSIPGSSYPVPDPDTAKEVNEVRPQNELPCPLGSLGLGLNVRKTFFIKFS